MSGGKTFQEQVTEALTEYLHEVYNVYLLCRGWEEKGKFAQQLDIIEEALLMSRAFKPAPLLLKCEVRLSDERSKLGMLLRAYALVGKASTEYEVMSLAIRRSQVAVATWDRVVQTINIWACAPVDAEVPDIDENYVCNLLANQERIEVSEENRKRAEEIRKAKEQKEKYEKEKQEYGIMG